MLDGFQIDHSEQGFLDTQPPAPVSTFRHWDTQFSGDLAFGGVAHSFIAHQGSLWFAPIPDLGILPDTEVAPPLVEDPPPDVPESEKDVGTVDPL